MRDDFFSSTIPKELMFLLIGLVIIGTLPLQLLSQTLPPDPLDKAKTEELINKLKTVEAAIERAEEEKRDLIVKKAMAEIKTSSKDTKKLEELRQKLLAFQKEHRNKQAEVKQLKRKLEEKSVFLGERSIRIARSTDKEPFYFEVVRNRVYAVNEANYDIYEETQQLYGIIFQVGIKRVLKEDARGDNFTNVARSNSVFNRTLNQLDSEKHYLVFVLHETSSFSLFRKARDIANRAGFATGWEPVLYEEGMLRFGGTGARRPYEVE